MEEQHRVELAKAFACWSLSSSFIVADSGIFTTLRLKFNALKSRIETIRFHSYAFLYGFDLAPDSKYALKDITSTKFSKTLSPISLALEN